MEILNLKSTITEIKISLAGLDGKFKLTEKKNQKTQISIDVAIQRTDRKKKKNNKQT